MTCATCVAAIEGLVDPKRGLLSVNVNLVMADAVVKFDPLKITVDGVIEAIEEIGFEAKIKLPSIGVVVFDIEGMTCSSCSQAVEAGLASRKGVAMVAVNLVENTCAIEYDSTVVGARDLMEAIEDLGEQTTKKYRNPRDSDLKLILACPCLRCHRVWCPDPSHHQGCAAGQTAAESQEEACPVSLRLALCHPRVPHRHALPPVSRGRRRLFT